MFHSLNEHSKKIQLEQQSLAQKYDEMILKYEELERLKNNIDKFVQKSDEPKKGISKQIKKSRMQNDEKIITNNRELKVNQENNNVEL